MPEMICEFTEKSCLCPQCAHRIQKRPEAEVTGIECLKQVGSIMLFMFGFIGFIFWMCG